MCPTCQDTLGSDARLDPKLHPTATAPRAVTALPCSCTMCHGCYLDTVKSLIGKDFTCPLCRRRVQVPLELQHEMHLIDDNSSSHDTVTTDEHNYRECDAEAPCDQCCAMGKCHAKDLGSFPKRASHVGAAWLAESCPHCLFEDTP